MSNGDDNPDLTATASRPNSPEDDKDISFPHGNPAELDPVTLLGPSGGVNAAANYLYGDEAKAKARSIDEGVARFKVSHPKLLDLYQKDPQGLDSGDSTWIGVSDVSWEVVKKAPTGAFEAALGKGMDLLNKWSKAAGNFFGREGASADTPTVAGLSVYFQQYQAHVSEMGFT